MNPQAETLNDILRSNSPTIPRLLSQKGLDIFYPKEGILKQSADAKGTKYNATIGMVKDDNGVPGRLQSIGKYIDLTETDSVTYAPSAGKEELRKKWKELLYIKNPSLEGKEVTTPITTDGLTHGLSMVGYLFLDPEEKIIIPDKFWGNY